MPPSSTIAYIIMQFCHLYGIAGMHIFVSGGQNQAYILICRFTAGIQNCLAGSAPVPTAALPAPAMATTRGAARPTSPPAPKLAAAAVASADARFAAAVPGSTPDLAAGAGSGRLQVGGGCSSGGGLSAEAPAAAMSRALASVAGDCAHISTRYAGRSIIGNNVDLSQLLPISTNYCLFLPIRDLSKRGLQRLGVNSFSA